MLLAAACCNREVAALADRDAELALRVRRPERGERLAGVCEFVAVLDRDAESSVLEESGEALQVLGCRLGHEVEAPGAFTGRAERGCKAPAFREQRVLWRERDYIEDCVDAVGMSFANGRLEVGRASCRERV